MYVNLVFLLDEEGTKGRTVATSYNLVIEGAILEAPASPPGERAILQALSNFQREGVILSAPASSTIPTIVRDRAIQLNGSFLHFDITANSTHHAVSTLQSLPNSPY